MKDQKDLIDIVQSKSQKDYDRWIAASYLGDFGQKTGQETVDVLVSVLNDKNINVRDHAADSLGRIALSSKLKDYVVNKAVEPLIRLLTDDDSLGAASAAKTLGVIGGDAVVEHLINVLDNKNKWWQIRKNAARALGIIGDKQAVEVLIRALKEIYSPDIRIAAAESLGKIKDPRAIEHLKNVLEDDNINVKIAAQSAIKALKKIDNKNKMDI